MTAVTGEERLGHFLLIQSSCFSLFLEGHEHFLLSDGNLGPGFPPDLIQMQRFPLQEEAAWSNQQGRIRSQLLPETARF